MKKYFFLIIGIILILSGCASNKAVSTNESNIKTALVDIDYGGIPASYIRNGQTFVRGDILQGKKPFILVPSTTWEVDTRYQLKYNSSLGYYVVEGAWAEFQVKNGDGDYCVDFGKLGNWVGEGQLDPKNKYTAKGVFIDTAKKQYVLKPIYVRQ